MFVDVLIKEEGMEQRFEHKVVVAPVQVDYMLPELRKAEKDGWELVAVADFGAAFKVQLFFKRPVKART